MSIYSNKIFQFLAEIKKTIKNILSQEMGLKVHGERFYDRAQRTSYPLQIVIFNERKMLGYFDPLFFELGFHERLMFSGKQQLHDVIRHELAHYLTWIAHGNNAQPHGPEFRAFCQSMGWGEEIYRATSCLEEEQSEVEESAVLRKIKKLMALSTSSNENESEAAMIKSQQLLLKHNIESKYVGSEDEEKMVLKRIVKQKKTNAKMRAIATILQTFFVSVIFRRTAEFTCLEILGTPVNVEIAEYVASFLDVEMDRLWSLAPLKGMTAKNSFFLGIAKGYCNKVKSLKRTHSNEESSALMVLEKQLVDVTAMVYGRLSYSSSRTGHCPASSALGQQMGKNLNINAAVGKSSAGPLLLPS